MVVPIMAFSLVISHKYLQRNGMPQKKVKNQAELLSSTNTLPFLPLLSLYISICVSIYTYFYYPFIICDPLMFHLYTCGHTEVSVMPRHFQNHSTDFCVE